jgi:uncharacterized protein (TIGR00369 family)
MTGRRPPSEPPDTISDPTHARFGIDLLDADPDAAMVTMSMPMSRFHNPITGSPTVGPLAILVDSAAGLTNHFRRGTGQWTLSTELNLELGSEIGDDLDDVVVASARPLGPVGATSLSVCTLAVGGVEIGTGTVRSFFIPADGVVTGWPPDTLERTGRTPLTDLMAVFPQSTVPGAAVLGQRVDPNLNNGVGIVHGGVASAGVELAASAAINAHGSGAPLRTGSLRVNFLRPFFAGTNSRYVGTAVKVGRSIAVGDAQAIGDDNKIALLARVTAYR